MAASRNTSEIDVGSRLIADLVAERYGIGLKEHAHGRLLDLGCGKVPLFIAYRDYVVENTCVDWANSLHGNEYLDLECDLTKPLPLTDDEFDTIVLSDVLEHIPEPEKLWKEMSRLLASGGKIIMNVPFLYWLHEEPHDYYRYTEFALRRFVDRSGLELVEITPIGGAVEIVVDICSRMILKIPMVGRPIASFLQWAASAFSRTGPGRWVARLTGRKFPYGYFLIASKTPGFDEVRARGHGAT